MESPDGLEIMLREARNALLGEMRDQTRKLSELIASAEEVGWHWLAHELRLQKDGIRGMIRMYEETLSGPKWGKP